MKSRVVSLNINRKLFFRNKKRKKMHSIVQVFKTIKKNISILKKWKIHEIPKTNNNVPHKTNRIVLKQLKTTTCIDSKIFGQTKVKKNKKILNENNLIEVLDLFF